MNPAMAASVWRCIDPERSRIKAISVVFGFVFPVRCCLMPRISHGGWRGSFRFQVSSFRFGGRRGGFWRRKGACDGALHDRSVVPPRECARRDRKEGGHFCPPRCGAGSPLDFRADFHRCASLPQMAADSLKPLRIERINPSLQRFAVATWRAPLRPLDTAGNSGRLCDPCSSVGAKRIRVPPCWVSVRQAGFVESNPICVNRCFWQGNQRPFTRMRTDALRSHGWHEPSDWISMWSSHCRATLTLRAAFGWLSSPCCDCCLPLQRGDFVTANGRK